MGKWLISTYKGNSPLWSPEGREIYFLIGYQNTEGFMAVEIETEPAFKPKKPRLLFNGSYVGAGESSRPWDIHPDGKRFLMMKRPGTIADESSTEEDEAAGAGGLTNN